MTKKIRIVLFSLSTVFALALFIGIYTYNNNDIEPKQSVVVSKSYAAEVKDPQWCFDHSDLIICGKIVGKEQAAIGKDGIYGNNVVYEDTIVEINEIQKNTLDKNLEVGKQIIVRTLGGTVGDFEQKEDTQELLSSSNKVLLCLVDVSKTPAVPADKNKKIYSIVGSIHGAFELTDDGHAYRKVVKDSFNFDELKSKIKK
jgi:hypothetical protein